MNVTNLLLAGIFDSLNLLDIGLIVACCVLAALLVLTIGCLSDQIKANQGLEKQYKGLRKNYEALIIKCENLAEERNAMLTEEDWSLLAGETVEALETLLTEFGTTSKEYIEAATNNLQRLKKLQENSEKFVARYKKK